MLVIGAGQMAQLLIKHLLHIGCKDITLINRSHKRALRVADRFGIAHQNWTDLDKQLGNTDIVISSAAAQNYLFPKEAVSQTLRTRKSHQLLVIDIAVPRNFDPAVNELQNVHLYSIDDLAGKAQLNRKARKKDVSEASQIIENSVNDFADWFRAKDIGPLIGIMKTEFAKISQKDLNSFLASVSDSDLPTHKTESTAKRIANKSLHRIIKNVNGIAQKNGPAEAVKLLDDIVNKAEQISLPKNTDPEQSL